MKKSMGFLLGFICITHGWSQNQPKAYNFNLLSQQDDFSFLKEIPEKSAYDAIKYIPFGRKGVISFGADLRFQTEHYVHEEFGSETAYDRFWYLVRNLYHAHYRRGEKWEVYGELNTAWVWNKPGPSPVDEDHLSVNQLFVAYKPGVYTKVFMGRENLNLGSRRLVDVREGPNVRRSFDLLKFLYQKTTLSALVLAGIPVYNTPGSFDNDYLHHNEIFAGTYITRKWSASKGLDVYGLYQYKRNTQYNAGPDVENRYSLGFRYFGSKNNWRFDHEVVLQTGTFGTATIWAWTASFKGDYTYTVGSIKGLAGLKTELISGDKNPADHRLNTFNSLYPRGAYFGRVAKFGPANLMDVHPYIQFFEKQWYAELDYDVFWRYSVHDAVYNPALKIAYPPTDSAKFIGHQLGTLSGVNIGPHYNMELETNFIIPGDFLRESHRTQNLFHIVLTTEFKF